jgi:hypothetical protein
MLFDLTRWYGIGIHYVSYACLLTLLAFLNACGSSPGAMDGTWLFTLTSYTSFNQVTATGNLKQSGSQVTGTVVLRGNDISCTADTSVVGTINGSSLNLQFTQGQSIANLTGAVSTAFTSGSGVYVVMGTSCLHDFGSGTWAAVFIGS